MPVLLPLPWVVVLNWFKIDPAPDRLQQKRPPSTEEGRFN
jgi:hypothetical protein